MEIKKVTNSNKKEFHLTYIKALQEGFIGFVPIKMISEFNKNFQKYYKAWKSNEFCEMYIAYEENQPLGIIVFGKSEIDGTEIFDAQIDSLYFRDFAHGKGYAKELLSFAEIRLKDFGYKRILLWCSKENKRAWKFYLKNGYVPTQQYWDDNLDGKIFHNVLFVKQL